MKRAVLPMMGSRRERSEAFPTHHAELVSVCHRERLYISVTGLIGQKGLAGKGPRERADVPLTLHSENESKNWTHCSQEVILDGIAGGSAARGDGQLVVKRAHMRFDGEQTNDELLSNLCITQSGLSVRF